MVAISLAGIITTIVIGAQSAVKRDARATSKFAKTLAKIAEKAVPVIGALLNLAAKVLTLGTKAVGFLSEHLWILAVAIAYALYERCMNVEDGEEETVYVLKDIESFLLLINKEEQRNGTYTWI